MKNHQLSIERYEAYKDSGIEWICEVPEHWNLYKISQSFDQIGSGTTPKSGSDVYYENGTVNWINTGDLNDGLLMQCKRKVTNQALREHSLTVYPSGSIVIAMYGATIGKISILKIAGCTNQACCVLNESKVLEIRFLFYWFLSKRNFIISLSYGGGQPNISQDTIKSLRVCAPLFSEQKAIARYLDTKTAQIDRKIDLLTQKATLYSNLKQSLINETVTRGLDKSVAMKDSGVEWLGKVPEHWEVKRVKEIFDIGRGRVISQLELIEDGIYPVYSSQTKDNGCLGYLNTFDFEGEYITWTTDGVNAGTVFLRQGKFNCTNICGTLKLRSQKKTLQYLLYFLQVITKHNKRIDTNGAKIMNNEMALIKIAIPPLSEQKAIADYLDTKTAQIDQIIQTINTQIDKLKELRKILINDVVTGKIKVI